MDNKNALGSAITGQANTKATVGESGNNTNSPVEEVVPQTKGSRDEDLDKPYIDRSSVTISLVNNPSLFRIKNAATMPKRNNSIGSSYNASVQLSSSEGEVNKYFPNIIGLSASHDDFTYRVKQWLSNIKVHIDDLGKTLDTSFHYDKKRYYLEFQAKMNDIEEAYIAADRSNTLNLKRALDIKITAIHNLESTKYAYGHPMKPEEYLIYRHCLLYRPVAKDLALVNSDPSILFYFKDDKREADKAKKHRQDVNKAKANYVALLADEELFNAVYIQYLVEENRPVLSSLTEDVILKENKLDIYSTQQPVKFNKIYSNKHVRTIGLIELLIARGEFTRSTFNQNITTSEGLFIGSNITEAVAWMNNPENKSLVDTYHNKLRNI